MNKLKRMEEMLMSQTLSTKVEERAKNEIKDSMGNVSSLSISFT